MGKKGETKVGRELAKETCRYGTGEFTKVTNFLFACIEPLPLISAR